MSAIDPAAKLQRLDARVQALLEGLAVAEADEDEELVVVLAAQIASIQELQAAYLVLMAARAGSEAPVARIAPHRRDGARRRRRRRRARKCSARILTRGPVPKGHFL